MNGATSARPQPMGMDVVRRGRVGGRQTWVPPGEPDRDHGCDNCSFSTDARRWCKSVMLDARAQSGACGCEGAAPSMTASNLGGTWHEDFPAHSYRRWRAVVRPCGPRRHLSE